jgi:hypothetical protein
MAGRRTRCARRPNQPCRALADTSVQAVHVLVRRRPVPPTQAYAAHCAAQAHALSPYFVRKNSLVRQAEYTTTVVHK